MRQRQSGFENSYYSGDLPVPRPDLRVEISETPVTTQLPASQQVWLSGPEAASPQAFSASPEFDLLCLCARTKLTPERVRQIEAVNASALNWEELFRTADHHGVLPLIAKNLLAHARSLPAQIQRSLQSAYESNLRRNLWFAGEFARITEHFEKRKIRVVPYKGPVLAESAYGDLALRTFNDLDFLVSAPGFEAAQQALAELGYQPSKPLSPERKPLWLKFGYECAFDSAAGKYLVELQWNLLPPFYAVDLDTERLLDRAVTARIGGRESRILSPEDLLLVLCLHAAKHLWMRLIWIVDIAETVQSQRIDYAVLTSRAQELGVVRIVAVSFWLGKNMLQAELPPCAHEIIDADPEVPGFGQIYADRLQRNATYDFESSEYFRLMARLRENRADSWRYLWRLLWTPGEGDLTAIRLPEPLFPLYRLVRLARLLRKATARM